MNAEYHVIGLMSGTSLDGLDIAYCKFVYANHQWYVELLHSDTVDYADEWREVLSNIENGTALEYARTHVSLGEYFGNEVLKFINNNKIKKLDFISSHGHTVFHQPSVRLTTQIGNGASIAAICGFPVVCDFRITDMALGGQGAPLVPIGDKMLFAKYDFCINLGGIANVSFNYQASGKPSDRVAFDVCFVNIVLNYLAKQLGREYDMNGEIAREGSLDKYMMEMLEELDYYSHHFPKSLGKEWFIENIKGMIDNVQSSIPDKLHTYTQHIAKQIVKDLKPYAKDNAKVLLSGGGAFNAYLVELLRAYAPSWEIEVPEEKVVMFKEAIIFGFLGVLRWRGENNCLSSVTGASRDNCGGVVFSFR
ncbi:MAG: anhydro-N-acetylmuramic acid kinase [Cytophagales bacterium]|nr:MAG: anhydro-N-acetylmuramic acid kinase [Cytophagales bacterium]